jgi:hypothetical protein
MPYLERHNETDKVFVLLEGACTLYIGHGDAASDQINRSSWIKEALQRQARGLA